MLLLLCNRQNIAAYEAQWLMGFSIINHWGAHSPVAFALQFVALALELDAFAMGLGMFALN